MIAQIFSYLQCSFNYTKYLTTLAEFPYELSKMKNETLITKTKEPFNSFSYQTKTPPNANKVQKLGSRISESLLDIIPHCFPARLKTLLLRSHVNKREISSYAEEQTADDKCATGHRHLPRRRRIRPHHHSIFNQS